MPRPLLLDDDPFLGASDVGQEVALAYRRVWRAARAAGATAAEYEQAALDAAVRKRRELDPTALLDRHDAGAAALAIVGDVILANTAWFWHGPDA
jgi:hypothetical protein